MPDIRIVRDDITIKFNNYQYLKSPEFMNREVFRTVDLHKPLIFTGTNGYLYLNEALSHPNYHKISIPKSEFEK
eukprot:gene977-4221_t